MQPELEHTYRDAVPELSLAWSAADFPDLELVCLNEPLAESLGLDPQWLASPEGIAFLAGQGVPDTTAQAYAGHQFGQYSPRLGDGRALLLGELVDPDGARHDLHLKGSGRTPFSRGGDGLAPLGPMLREYLISEAMAALQIPTTRSLAVLSTGQTVQRDRPEPGAILCRVAASHLRVGTFQYAAASGEIDWLRALADHAIARHHPDLATGSDPYLGLFGAVADTQALLVARWMHIGFVHGVMNTDNMTISGETIDYGPCAFLDRYEPASVFSSIDRGGRYAYDQQPTVAMWNLARFAETLAPLIAPDDPTEAVPALQEQLQLAAQTFERSYADGLAAKFGLAHTDPAEVDRRLAEMAAAGVDFTEHFAAQTDAAPGVNPAVIPRNHQVEEALVAATNGDLTDFDRVLRAVQQPYRPDPTMGPAPAGAGPIVTYCGT